jgi:hypothetical protein
MCEESLKGKNPPDCQKGVTIVSLNGRGIGNETSLDVSRSELRDDWGELGDELEQARPDL